MPTSDNRHYGTKLRGLPHEHHPGVPAEQDKPRPKKPKKNQRAAGILFTDETALRWVRQTLNPKP